MNKISSPNQKVIVLLVFIIAAILSSFFLFHLRHEQKPLLANNDVTLFNVARDVKEFELVQGNGNAFKQKELRGHWTLMFFGFTHCAQICPATLEMLTRAYKELKPLYPNLQVVLVSVDPERDTPTFMLNYTKKYHTDFIGATGTIQAVRKLQSQLGVFAEKETTDSSHYQVQHTSSILLFNPKGQWTGSIRYGLSPQQFVITFKESMDAFNS